MRDLWGIYWNINWFWLNSWLKQLLMLSKRIFWNKHMQFCKSLLIIVCFSYFWIKVFDNYYLLSLHLGLLLFDMLYNCIFKPVKKSVFIFNFECFWIWYLATAFLVVFIINKPGFDKNNLIVELNNLMVGQSVDCWIVGLPLFCPYIFFVEQTTFIFRMWLACVIYIKCICTRHKLCVMWSIHFVPLNFVSKHWQE